MFSQYCVSSQGGGSAAHSSTSGNNSTAEWRLRAPRLGTRGRPSSRASACVGTAQRLSTSPSPGPRVHRAPLSLGPEAGG